MLGAFRDLLVCPECRRPTLELRDEGEAWARCTGCARSFWRVQGLPYLTGQELLQAARGEASAGGESTEQEVKRANIAYHDKFVEQYEHDTSTRDMFVPGGNCQQRIDAALEAAARQTHRGVLLDVCCGTGNILNLARRHYDSCLGIDLSARMMGVSRSRGFSVLGADACRIPLRDASVDCVTAFSALHHICDYSTTVEEMARVLKPGGIFYSDWDPNGHASRRGWAVSLASHLLRSLRQAGDTSPIEEDELQAKAEFHHGSPAGFSGELVASCLERRGFSSVKVLHHFNPPRLEDVGYLGVYGVGLSVLKALSLIPPTRRNSCPWVAVLARKQA